MTDRPFPQHAFTDELRREAGRLVSDLAESLGKAISEVDARPAMPVDPDAVLSALREPLPETGEGARAALERLLDLQARAGANTAGPRCFHFVIGGSTPAGQGADLIASAFDVVTYTCDRPAVRRGDWDDDASVVVKWGRERQVTRRYRLTPEGLKSTVVKERVVRSGCGGTRG